MKDRTMPKCPNRAEILVAFAILLFAAFPSMAQLPPEGPMREWTFPGGVAARAALRTFDGKTVGVRLLNGQLTNIPVDSLSEADRAYLADWQERQPVVMPDSVGVDSSKLLVEIVSEDEQNGKFVYRTPHFEFTSDGKLTLNLLRDVTRNFEATYGLLKALPWGVQPEPEEGDRFHALLVRSRVRYEEEGGPKNSGGVYYRSRKLFVVPFESLGIDRSDTLVHELTHQMMHAWLEILPQWVIEGTAEYTNAIPLRTGIFRVSAARNGLKDYVASLKARGGVPEPFPLEKLFGISGKEWSETLARDPKESHRMYFTAYLLVNYFMHMDGKGDGAIFVKYMHAVCKGLEQVAKYEADLAAFKKLPGVEVLPDGRYRWSGSLTPPAKPEILASAEKRSEFEKSTLDVLLNGRTTAELMNQIRIAYRRAGIKL